MCAESVPLVSIGLPVHNGAAFLAAALDAILAQTYPNFELIIADNASSDETPEIVAGYAERDPRIRAFRHRCNMGAAANFNFVFVYARGAYFKWAAHDDLLAPDYLAPCVAALQADRRAVLCSTDTVFIDVEGSPIAPAGIRLPNTNTPQASARFAGVLLTSHWSFEAFGLIRRAALVQTRLITPHVMSDKELLAELALRGRFAHVPQPLFLSREHAGRSVRAFAPHRRVPWFSTGSAKRFVLPHWQTLLGYVQAVQRVALPPAERVRCYGVVAHWVLRPRNAIWLALDVPIAACPPAGDLLWSAKSRWGQHRVHRPSPHARSA